MDFVCEFTIRNACGPKSLLGHFWTQQPTTKYYPTREGGTPPGAPKFSNTIKLIPCQFDKAAPEPSQKASEKRSNFSIDFWSIFEGKMTPKSIPKAIKNRSKNRSRIQRRFFIDCWSNLNTSSLEKHQKTYGKHRFFKGRPFSYRSCFCSKKPPKMTSKVDQNSIKNRSNKRFKKCPDVD